MLVRESNPMSPKRLSRQKPSSPIEGYDSIISELVNLVESARRVSARSVNAVMTATYWEIGRRVVEFEQKGKKRAEYRTIERLAADLTVRFGRGFGRANLAQMRKFFLTWPQSNIVQTLSGPQLKKANWAAPHSRSFRQYLENLKRPNLLQPAAGSPAAFRYRGRTTFPAHDALEQKPTKTFGTGGDPLRLVGTSTRQTDFEPSSTKGQRSPYLTVLPSEKALIQEIEEDGRKKSLRANSRQKLRP